MERKNRGINTSSSAPDSAQKVNFQGVSDLGSSLNGVSRTCSRALSTSKLSSALNESVSTTLNPAASTGHPSLSPEPALQYSSAAISSISALSEHFNDLTSQRLHRSLSSPIKSTKSSFSGLPSRVIRRWQLLTGLALSVALCLGCPSSGLLCSNTVPVLGLSSVISTAMGIDSSTLRFQDYQVKVLSPRIPSLIFPLLKGARLLEPLFRKRWLDFSQQAKSRGITASEAVQMARHGFVPHLVSPPLQFRPPAEPRWDESKLIIMEDLVSQRLASSIVEKIPAPDFSTFQTKLALATAMCYYGGIPWLVPALILPFVSILFPVPKPNSEKWRDVMGMSRFNDFVYPQRMEGLHTVRAMLRPLDYMVVIDVESAFPTLGIHPRYRDYFIFRFRGQYYRYRGAVFGISSLPRAWKKLLAPVIAFLRSFGIRLAVFVDDIFLCAASYVQCAQDCQDIIIILWWLGFNIAPKCLPTLIPAQQVVWTGVLIDSIMMEFRLEPKRLLKIRKTCLHALSATQSGTPLKLRQWASVLGNCRSSMCAVLPALLWSQAIKRLVNSKMGGPKSIWDLLVPCSQVKQEVLDNLQIWLSPKLNLHNGRPIRPPPATVLTDSDASGFGGGMVMTSPHSAECRVHFDQVMFGKHINLKELVMHLKGLQGLDLQMPGLAFSNLFQNRTDNSVSMSYVNRQGGRVLELSLLAESLWTWLIAHDSSIYALFVPGIENDLADAASRHKITRGDLKLLEKWFTLLHRLWGPYTIDAFASQMNCQLPRFWSRYTEDKMAARDALQQSWSGENLWINAPYVLIPRILSKIVQFRVISATIIAPLWPSQPWWPVLLGMTTAVQPLGNVDKCHYAPTVLHERKQLLQPWQVAAFRVSFRVSNSRDIISALASVLFRNGKMEMLTLQ